MRSGIGNSASDPFFVSDVGGGTSIATGAYSTTPPVLTNGQNSPLQVGSRGSLAVTLWAKDSTNFAALAAPANGQATQTSLYVTSQGVRHNGASWDFERKPNLFARVASSAASGNPASVKASAGDVMAFWGSCSTNAVFLQLYNKASAPVIGTDTPILTFPIIANANFSQTIPNGGAYFPLGIAYAFTTDAAGATGSAAAAITAFALLAA